MTEITVLVAAGGSTRSRVRRAIAAAGMTVAADCTTAAEAIETAARRHPDVCVLVRGLPGGVLAATAAIGLPREPSKVLVVGGASPAEVRAARLAGAADCLSSDAGDAELAAAVVALVRKELE